MNNKDSKTYKDMYHFSEAFYPLDRDRVPSLEADPKINTTIKKNPYRSNVEIEKDEIILEPDMSALFQAKGKKHSGGGIDVLLKPESFVFSDDKSLAFTKQDCDRFEFKKVGGKNHSPKHYTPAKVLKKNIDIEHYNILTSNLQDVKKDDLAKKSSVMMLDKYFQTLGNIAFLQEQKKNFPQGVPEFAAGTAPVYDADLKAEVMEQKQYARYGGKIDKPSAQYGFINNMRFMNNPPDFQAGSPRPPRGRKPGEWIMDPVTLRWFRNKTLPNVTVRSTGAEENLSGVPPVNSGVPPIAEPPAVPTTPVFNLPPIGQRRTPDTFTGPTLPTPTPNTVTGETQAGKQVNWDFTPYQKLQFGLDALEYASIKRYMPYRSRFNPSFADPTLVNPEQAIGDLKGAAYQQTQATNILSPILRNAQQSDIYGQLLNQMPGVRSQYDNQNASIQNQFRSMNTQIANQARLTNMQNDQRYYQESVVGQQNFDNAKAVAATAFKNDFFQSVSDNETLALNLLAQGPNPAYGYNFKTGDFFRNPQNILDTPTDTKSDLYTQLANTLMEKINSGKQLTRPEVDFFKGLSLGKIQFNPSFQKKGGKVKRNPYRY